MAANPPCQFEGCEQPSTFTGTFFETGQSIIVCGEHFVAFAGGTLEAITGVPVLDIIATVSAEPESEDSATEGVEIIAGGDEHGVVERNEASPMPDDEPRSSASPESSSAPTDTDENDGISHLDLVREVVDMPVVAPDSEPDALTHS